MGKEGGCWLTVEQALHRCLVTCKRLLVGVRIRKERGLISLGCLLYFRPVIDAELTGFGAIES
ncbi:hypothetical protein NGM29_20085 (plasmid) [Natronosalvus rutilus]|uniref:Uncharacterized protein n=1 Tax=Natronosalvus rutilus TaxID=2953753 RepID=A0A9E7NCG5_9EURY|nr:hypothetical protein NGM29_20085 [Natronosalvus rutilus]